MRLILFIFFLFASNGLFSQAYPKCCDNDNQQLSINGDVISLENGGSVTIDPCQTWVSSSSFDNSNQQNGFQLWSFGLQDDCGNNFNVNGRDDFGFVTNNTITFPNGNQFDCNNVIDCLPSDLQDGDDVDDADNDPTNEIQTITQTTETVRTICYEARGYNNTVEHSYNVTVTNTSNGEYSVVFNPPNPQGNNYTVTFAAEEDANRDVPKISIVRGSRTANGFDFIVTVDDNGGTADVYNDAGWQFQATCEKTFVTNVIIN